MESSSGKYQGSTILWQGREYTSLENCHLNVSQDAITADSVIVGSYRGSIYRVVYSIRANPEWEVLDFSVDCRVDGTRRRISAQSDGKGNWREGEKLLAQFSGCKDIDISLTPFTNTLPIRRLDLLIDQEKIIDVLYLDLLSGEVKPVKQKYTRVSVNEYRYEDVPKDFEALIVVDEKGLVADYPGLFIRTGIH